MSFDRLAPHYRWMEAILAGSLLQRCRTRWLSEVQGARHALLAGEGNGRMLEACATALPDCRFTVLDQSEAMLEQARRRWEKSGRKQKITFEIADLRKWRFAGEKFDLIITNFFLDCFTSEELSEVIANLNGAASNQAQWLVTDFCVPASGWRRLRAQAVLELAYAFFRTTTKISANRIVPPDSNLRMAGFRMQRRELFNHDILCADLWERANKHHGP